MFHHTLPYIAGIGCSLCYGSGVIFELIAARRQENIDSLSLFHLARLFKQPYYLAGMALDFLGWLLFLFSARRLPLFLSLSFVVLSLAVAALIEEFALRATTTLKTKLSILVIVSTLVLLGLSAKQSQVHLTTTTLNLIIEITPIPMALIGTLLLKSKKPFFSSSLLAVLCGLAFGATGLIARIVHFPILNINGTLLLLVAALIAYAIEGTIFMAAALQRVAVNIVNCIMFTVELIVPSMIGLIFLGDTARRGFWPLMIVCLAFIIAATIVITLDSKVEEIEIN